MTPISEEHFTHFHYGEVLVGQEIHLDGHFFADCTFELCKVFFEGRRPFGFVRCTHDRTIFVLDGDARRILEVLVHGLDPTALAGLIADIRAG